MMNKCLNHHASNRVLIDFIRQSHALNRNTNFTSNNNSNSKIFIQKRNAAAFKFVPEVAPASLGETTKMNLCQSITNALDISLSADKSAGWFDLKQKKTFLDHFLII